MRRLATAALAAAALVLASAATAAPQRVQLPSLDREQGQPLMLEGHWFEAPPGAAPAPAMLLLHGCGGFLDARGRIGERYTELASRLNAMGVHALVLDSFGPRGTREVCTQAAGQRRITQLNRRRDALGGLAWLAAQPGVDAARLGLLGWSNGGSTALAASNERHPEVARAPVRASLAVAYYPGCELELQRGYQAAAPLLLLLGEADDWTPAAPCKALAAALPAIQWEAYEGAHHGFDGTAPLRHRRDVPGGVNPGQGVHVGGQPAARAASQRRLDRFLRETWSLAP